MSEKPQWTIGDWLALGGIIVVALTWLAMLACFVMLFYAIARNT